ncbi:uncharacterized protein LOC123549787 [Mercenaria mercenaria]|uniref:uncharacterized protein LOC123549787 n=1 Tax=Mercenaria mercenaria TaxID=6596 RepID=UPI00234F3D20|nr:uncharacterized protein LOC123549787 [Mercenaria mercenaria]
MGTEAGNKNLSGLPMYHLRRIGPPASKQGVVNVMDFYRVTYMIGRSEVQVDFYIDSSNHIQSASISRCHARVVRQNGNQHRLYDDSLNGVFVNNMKIAGSCVLREGDKVTFGHPCGAKLPAGRRSRQPDSHHQFMFETCGCEQIEQNGSAATGNKETKGFKKPVSPAEMSGSNSTRKSKRAARKTTQCFSTDDVRKLKQAWEEKQSSSASDTSDVDDIATEASSGQTEIVAEKTVPVNVTDAGESNVQRNDEPGNIDTEERKLERTDTDGLLADERKGTKKQAFGEKPNSCVMDTSYVDDTGYEAGSEQTENEADKSDAGESAVLRNDHTDNAAVSREDEQGFGFDDEETFRKTVIGESDADSVVDMVNDADEQDRVLETETNNVESSVACGYIVHADNVSTAAEKDDLSALEGTVNSIIKDLCDLRGQVENSVEKSEHQFPVIKTKSPTKDACIQTTQSDKTVSEQLVNPSPTKDMGIQTSQVLFCEPMDTEEKVIASGIDNSAGISHVTVSYPLNSVANAVIGRLSEMENDSSSNHGLQRESSEILEDNLAINNEVNVESCSKENVDETFYTCIESANEDSDQKDAVDGEKTINSVDETSNACVESADEDSDQTDEEDGEKAVENDEETFNTCIESASEESDQKDAEDGRKSIENVNETKNTCIELASETTEKRMTFTVDTNEDSDIESLDLCSEDNCTVTENATVVKLSNEMEAVSDVKESSDGSESDENIECVFIQSKEPKCIGNNEKESVEVGDVCNETNVQKPGLMLSDSIEYEEDEENEMPGLLLSNSIEYSDDDSDRNISDSEDDENDGDENKSSTGDEDEKNEYIDNDVLNSDMKSIKGDKKSESEYETCEEVVDTIFNENVKQVITLDYNTSENLEGRTTVEKSLNEMEVCVGQENCLIDTEVHNKVTTNHSEIIDRKRKSVEELTSDMSCDSPRKRHCSENMNVLNEDKDDVKHEESAVINSNMSEEEEDESLSSSQKGLQKLKKGVKRFFKFWSKKSYNMNKNESSDGGYIYLQDKVGDYKLLEFDCPDKLSVVSKSKDVEDTKIEQVNVEGSECQSEIDSKDVGYSARSDTDSLHNVGKNRSDEEIGSNGLADNVAEGMEEVSDLNMETAKIEESAASKHTGEMSCKEMVVETESASEETEAESEDSVAEENSDIQTNKDLVETSMCQTDSEIDSNEMIKSSILASAFRTPSKHLSNTRKGQTSPAVSPVLKELSNQDFISQSQSPVIARQGVTNSNKASVENIKSSVIQLFGKETNKEVVSQLSCRFSDDDDGDDFGSPEIDFSHLDDESGDEIVEDSEDDSNQDVISKYELNTNCDSSKGEVESENEIDTESNERTDMENENGEDIDKEDNSEFKGNYTENIVDKDARSSDTLNVKTNDTVDDCTSDPLESYINHETEDDGDNESIDDESNEKGSILDDIDFDFCDTESEKENVELPASGINEEIVLDVDDDDIEEGSDTKQALKRKYDSDSDSEDRSPKKHQSLTKIAKLEDTSTPKKESNSTFTPFKTPTAMLKAKQLRTPGSCRPSPDHCSSTQLMDNTQTPDLDTLTMTQVTKVTEQLEVKAGDSSRSKASRNKAKDLLEKLKAKRRIKEEALDDFPSSSPTADSSQSTEIEIYSRTGNSLRTERTQAQAVLEDVNKHVNSCRDVINKMKSTFDSCKSLQGNPRVVAWRRELLDIEKRLQFPKTVIAVVGDTGAGKSSLMNAILDHRSVLPTSGIRACTAVVVEVVNNIASSNFEADIEFLQRQEWMEELQILLKDLTGLDGTVKNRPPDPTSDAFVSYCKVRAVYGRIDRFEVLARLTTVTHWLGRVKVIKSSKPGDFRRQVEKYIETQEPGAGGQYWPIVKHVRLRMPNCNVCSSGASLVDLPGVRDSNAARDKIAKEYLKNCTAVWVVSSIHRAIDDKTAKDLLGENFRRQLLMDGQYGSIAFICTKTDVLMPSEIIRPLELEDQTKEHEDQITEMESEKNELELRISSGTKEMRKLTKSIASLKTEAKELRDNLTELGNLIDSTDLDNSQSEEKEAIEEYEKELKEKVEELNEAENRKDELHDEKVEATQKTLELEKKLNVHRKAIAAICARARNEYSKTQIKRDFKAGLKEMKRRAGMLNDDDDEEEDIYSDEDDDDVGSSAENLKVFCCSSTEYQKMKNLLTDDGPPQVFNSLEDTQIPALRQYVHEMTSVRRRQWLERLIRNVGRFVFDLQMYVSEGGDMKSRDRGFAKSAIDSELQKFDTALAPVLQQLTADIDGVFDGSVRQKMEEGANNAANEASSTCTKWGAPVNHDPAKDKRSGGLHWATYRATVRRQGVYTSGSYGSVDFNEDLAEPMYRSMTIVWDRAFSGMLWKILDKLKLEILSKLKSFISELTPRLEDLGIQAIKTMRVSTTLLSSASNKLSEMVAHLKDIITDKQRDISRIITPHVQSSLLSEYNTSAAESGPGTYMRIKACMSSGIDAKRYTIFDEATQQLMHYLMELQNEVVQYVHQVCQTLIQDLRTAFEPLWEAPSNTSVIRSAFRQPITEACTRMHDIYDEAGLSHTEERALIPLVSGTPVGIGAATVAVCPGKTVSSDASGWQTFENTFQRKQDTVYGTMKQCGQVGVRVKTERLSQSCLSETTETVSRVQTLHIKQEKTDKTFDEVERKPSAVDQSLLNFGCQTLQDLQCGKLEVSPVEVTVQTTPVSVPAAPRPNVILAPTGQQNAIRYNHPGRIVVPVNSRQSSVGNVQYITQPSPVGHSTKTLGSLPQYVVQTLPDGRNVIQPHQMKSLITGQKTLIPNAKGPVTSTFVPSASAGAPSSDLLLNIAKQASGSTSSQTQNLHAINPVGRVQAAPVTNSQRKPSHTPTLNMVFGKENVSLNSSARNSSGLLSASQPCVNNSSHSKGKKKHGRANLSLSQKNAPVEKSAPALVIKTEPVDKGVYGRVKYLGSIDLTDD